MGTDLEAPPEADPYLGKTIAGRFEVENVLGEGGMGKVYGAKDLETGGMAALKVVVGQLTGNEEYVKRLQQEARTAGRLRHEAAVRIVAFGETESGAPYLAMEYCLGVTLKDMLAKEGHLPIARACNIASQMIDAVGSAHKQGIIHRDLKPENIKIAPDAMRGEAVKVLDFGVAKFIGGEDAPEMENAVKTKTGIILGTPKYMAPEQIRGEQVDGRADLYSCGAILYELLSGTPPFTADDVFGYVSKHLKEPPMKLADRVPEYAIPQELDDLVMWMLEKNPVQRPKDAASINAILDKFAKGSSSARLKFSLRVAACWMVPGIASFMAIQQMVPDAVDVLPNVEDAESPVEIVSKAYSMGLLKVHATMAAIGLSVAGTAGVLFQPRLSVMAYVRRLLLVAGLVVMVQFAAVIGMGGTPFAAAGYTITALLIFAAFSLTWSMESKPLQVVWMGLAAPLAAVLMNPVPLSVTNFKYREKLAEGAEAAPEVADKFADSLAAEKIEFFREIWHSDLWQQGMGEGSVGFYALVTALLLGLTFGIGSLFLPKPGRGSAG